MQNYIDIINANYNNWDYKNDIILAPMVRIGSLPTRLLSLKYGATMVYSPEYIDKCIIRCYRQISDKGIIEYIAPSGKLIFSTIKNEPISFQLGTSNSNIALEAVNCIINDVKAVDINMGCPLPYSTKGGMGVELLKKPELIVDILKTLKRNFNKPITCKIRLLNSLESTIELVKTIQTCNIDAITIHSRYPHDRTKKERARHDKAKIVFEHITISKIINGNIYTLEDANIIKKATNADSVMIARGAQYNPSVFSKDGFVPIYDILNQYIDIVKKINHPIKNTKYVVNAMIGPLIKDNNKLNYWNKTKNYQEMSVYINSLKSYNSIIYDYCPKHKNYFI